MSFVDSTMSSGPSSGTADSLANKHALYLSWDLRGDHHAAVRPTADELVDHGWEVTVVAGSDEASGGSPGGDGATWFGPDVRLVTVPSDLSSRGGALLDAVVRLHETHPITLMVAGCGPASGRPRHHRGEGDRRRARQEIRVAACRGGREPLSANPIPTLGRTARGGGCRRHTTRCARRERVRQPQPSPGRPAPPARPAGALRLRRCGEGNHGRHPE